MTKIYIDTNIFFNVWNEEIDLKSGKALWKGSKELLEKTEKKEFDDIKKLNIKINAPDSWVMIKALEYQMEYELDPYDSIAFAIADTAGCEIFVTRDGKIIKNIKSKMCGAEPEEILD